MRFIYNPFSLSSSQLQVRDGSWRWLLEGLLASPLTAKCLQVTGTHHRMVSSQCALKNMHVHERIMVMEWERQKVEPLHTGPQTKPATPAFQAVIQPSVFLLSDTT